VVDSGVKTGVLGGRPKDCLRSIIGAVLVVILDLRSKSKVFQSLDNRQSIGPDCVNSFKSFNVLGRIKFAWPID
jgi:hypothetical protein